MSGKQVGSAISNTLSHKKKELELNQYLEERFKEIPRQIMKNYSDERYSLVPQVSSPENTLLALVKLLNVFHAYDDPQHYCEYQERQRSAQRPIERRLTSMIFSKSSLPELTLEGINKSCLAFVFLIKSKDLFRVFMDFYGLCDQNHDFCLQQSEFNRLIDFMAKNYISEEKMDILLGGVIDTLLKVDTRITQ